MINRKSRIEQLEQEGWTQRFVANEPRLSESVELYKESGYEVHLEPLPKETECESCVGAGNADKCRICFEGFEDQYRIIFTRPTKAVAGIEEDLF
jgi:hypothetical protein